MKVTVLRLSKSSTRPPIDVVLDSSAEEAPLTVASVLEKCPGRLDPERQLIICLEKGGHAYNVDPHDPVGEGDNLYILPKIIQ